MKIEIVWVGKGMYSVKLYDGRLLIKLAKNHSKEVALRIAEVWRKKWVKS